MGNLPEKFISSRFIPYYKNIIYLFFKFFRENGHKNLLTKLFFKNLIQLHNRVQPRLFENLFPNQCSSAVSASAYTPVSNEELFSKKIITKSYFLFENQPNSTRTDASQISKIKMCFCKIMSNFFLDF